MIMRNIDAIIIACDVTITEANAIHVQLVKECDALREKRDVIVAQIDALQKEKNAIGAEIEILWRKKGMHKVLLEAAQNYRTILCELRKDL
jgi:uncharacterized coiled-coil DUF342 family protein